MKQLLIISLLLFSIINIQAQTTERWSQAYSRYEYYDSSGNLIGYKKKDVYGQWQYFDLRSSNNQPKTYKYPEYQSPYDMDLIERALLIKQQQYERQLEKQNQDKIETERKNIEKVAYDVELINNAYKNAPSYPETIKDGWHNICATNGYDMCEIRKVYVSNNKITQYVVDDWNYREIVSSLPIRNGMTTLTINKGENNMLNIIFIEYIYNRSSIAEAPQELGTISFWHDKKGGGNTYIWVDGNYAGKIDSYFKKDEPNCGQYGTASFRYKPGTYKYEAENDQSKWSGTITITSRQCSKALLRK